MLPESNQPAIQTTNERTNERTNEQNRTQPNKTQLGLPQ